VLQLNSVRSPSKELAVALDVGTDNEALLKDELYIASISPEYVLLLTARQSGLPERSYPWQALRRLLGEVRRISEETPAEVLAAF